MAALEAPGPRLTVATPGRPDRRASAQRHEPGAGLVPAHHRVDVGAAVQRVQQAEVALTGHAEHPVDPVRGQALDHQLSGCRHRLSPRTLSAGGYARGHRPTARAAGRSAPMSRRSSPLSSTSPGYLEALWVRFRADPASVDESWQCVFGVLDQVGDATGHGHAWRAGRRVPPTSSGRAATCWRGWIPCRPGPPPGRTRWPGMWLRPGRRTRRWRRATWGGSRSRPPISTTPPAGAGCWTRSRPRRSRRHGRTRSPCCTTWCAPTSSSGSWAASSPPRSASGPRGPRRWCRCCGRCCAGPRRRG